MKTKLSNYLWSRESLLIAALLAVDIALALIHGLTHSIDISIQHLDGTYQTASMLFRLVDGQWPGKDFFPYLGVGLLYLLSPVFFLAGGDVSASIFTTYFEVAFASSFSVGLIASLVFKQKRLLAGVVAASVSLIMLLWIEPAWLIERFTPGNSLRPLRSFVPYLSASLVYVLLRSRLGSIALYSAIGGIAGATFLWSNDYGLPTSVLLIVFGTIFAYRSGHLGAKVFLSMVCCAVFVGTLGLTIATMGHAIDLISYNFIDVRVDQYWYFAPWNTEARIFSISEFFSKFLFSGYFIGWWGVVWFVCLGVAYRYPTVENILLLFIGLVLFCGGRSLQLAVILSRGIWQPIFFGVSWSQSSTRSIC